MARKGQLKRQPVAPVAEETILREPKILLSLEERSALRVIFKTPAFVKAWNNAKLAKPGVFIGGLNEKRGKKIANNRLHEIRGWEMFEAALQRQILDPVLKKPAAPDDYPDAGLVDAPAKK